VTKPKEYGNTYVWAQLMFWMKQTIDKPEASLSIQRRGVISLPWPHSCYTGPGTKSQELKNQFDEQKRAKWLDDIKNRPNSPWPNSYHWGYRNGFSMYGSPWLDERILEDKMKAQRVVAELEHFQPDYSRMSGIPNLAPI